MTRVVHTGDTHLGYRQYHSPERRADFLAAFRQVIDDAIDDDVDVVVHAGDLFHDRRPNLTDVYGAIGVLGDLREADIPFLAIVGNHERTQDRQWLDLFETLGLATRLGREPTVIDDVAFYGLDYVPRSRRDDLEYAFESHGADHAALVAHGLFTPFNTEWDIEAVLENAPVDFDAVLLGDDHHPDTARVADTWVTYCGSTERASAAERDDRGYNIVTFDGDVTITRRGIDTRRFVLVDIELTAGEGVDRIRERVGQEDLEDAVVIVTLEGDGVDVPAARIEEFARERGALVARVNDRREFETGDVPEVRFTDPDEAIRERLREFGLSEAALAIDETVRGDIPDSNVRDRVKERVETLIDDDPGAFRRTLDDDGDDSPISTPDDGRTDRSENGGDDPDTVEANRGATVVDSLGPEPVPDGDDDADDGENDSERPERTDAPRADDDQVTMDDYL